MPGTQGIRAGKAFVELFADDSKLVRGLKSAQRKLKAFGTTITGWGKSLTLAGTAATAPLLGAAKLFGSVGDDLGHMADRTGFSVEALSELRLGVKLAGTDMNTFEGAIGRMQKSISDAGRGLATPVAALRSLGLSYQELKNQSPEKQFMMIGDALSRIENPTLRAAVAMDLLGRSGAALLPLFAQGAGGMEKMRDQARALGLTITGEDVKAAGELQATFDTLWEVLKMGLFVIGRSLKEPLESLAKTITRLIVNGTKWIKEHKAFIIAALKIGAAVVVAGIGLMGLGYAITALGAVLGGLAAIFAAVSASLGAVFTMLGAILTPIGLAVTAVGVLAAYLIYASGTGGKALEWLQERFADLADFAKESFGGIADALKAGDIVLAGKILWLSLKVAFQKGAKAIKDIWGELKSWTLHLVNDLWYGAQAAWEMGIHKMTKALIDLQQAYRDYQMWLDKTEKKAKAYLFEGKQLNQVHVQESSGKITHEQAEKARASIKKQYDDTISAIDGAYKDGFAAQDAMFNAQRQMEDKQHADNMSAISDADKAANAKVDADANKGINQSQADLDKARKEWLDAIGAAHAQAKVRKAGDLDLPDFQKRAPIAFDAAQKSIASAGTFNPMAAFALGGVGDSLAQRTAKATEETAKNTGRLLQMDFGGSAFA